MDDALKLKQRIDEQLKTGRVDVELFDALVSRLATHPQEFELFDPTTRNLRKAQLKLFSGPIKTAQDYTFRNLFLEWSAVDDQWTWPPEIFDDYIAMEIRHRGLRVVGEGWGMSAASHPKFGGDVLRTGEIASMSGTRVDEIDAQTIRCVLGAVWNDIHELLKTHAFADGNFKCLANQPGFSNLTVAGCIGVGGHGSSFALGPLSSMVKSIELGDISPTKTSKKITGSDLDLACTHVGRLGPVVAMELEVVDTYRIEETRTVTEMAPQDFPAFVEKAVNDHASMTDLHSIEIWLAPYPVKGMVTAALGVRKKVAATTKVQGKRPAALRSDALQMIGQMVAYIVQVLHLRSLTPRILRAAVKMVETQKVVAEARDGLDFGAPNNNDMASIEMAFDGVDKKALAELLKQLDTLSKNDLWIYSPVGVRFVGDCKHESLAMQAGRALTMHVEVPTFAKKVFQSDQILEPVQRALASSPFDARPHWGQRVYLTAPELARLWPKNNRQRMQAFISSVDPNGTFANPFIDDVLALP